MSLPTSEQLAKLPKWAQTYIFDLRRQRVEAIRALEKFTEENDAGPVRCRLMVCDGASTGPSIRDVRFDANWIEIDHAGIHLDITLVEGEVRFGYNSGKSLGPVYLKPTSFQQFVLKSKLEI